MNNNDKELDQNKELELELQKPKDLNEWTRRDVYGLKVKETEEDRIKRLAGEFEYHEMKKKGETFKDDLNQHSEKELLVNDFKKQWLSRYLFYKVQYEALSEEIEVIRDRGNRLVTRITGLPRGNNTSRPEDEWVEIINNTDMVLDCLCTTAENLLYALLEIETTIQNIEEPELQALLTMRYIKGMTTKEIQERVHYSRSHVWKLEMRALKRLDIDCTDKELRDRMDREYRFIEFQQDHFDPNKVDPDILAEYIEELKEDRDEAQKMIDQHQSSRRNRQKRRKKKEAFKQQKEAVESLTGTKKKRRGRPRKSENAQNE